MTKKLRQDAIEIFKAGLAAVEPKAAIGKYVSLQNNRLIVESREYALDNFNNVYVVGAGKAGASMAAGIESILGDRITGGIINVKYGHAERLQTIQIVEAAHPVPDEAGMAGTKKMIKMLAAAGERDLVICLLSGGGSALLPLPVEGISLVEKQRTTQRLLACGASINEINAVRKHISAVKGGQLARCVSPATLITLILSDVIGDPLDVIASGPTVPDSSTYGDVAAIFTKYDISAALPPTVVVHIEKGQQGLCAETPKPGDKIFNRTQNLIIASNTEAITASRSSAVELGYNTMILSSFIEGETRDVARVHAAILKEIIHYSQPLATPACIISGGETTVTIRGVGKGGRNQEFVLAAALDIAGLHPVAILSAGTDGTDGPTDAAGAICDGNSIGRAENMNLSAGWFLDNNDSYNFFRKLEDLIITGPTNTNVMDLRIMLVGEE